MVVARGPIAVARESNRRCNHRFNEHWSAVEQNFKCCRCPREFSTWAPEASVRLKKNWWGEAEMRGQGWGPGLKDRESESGDRIIGEGQPWWDFWWKGRQQWLGKRCELPNGAPLGPWAYSSGHHIVLMHFKNFSCNFPWNYTVSQKTTVHFFVRTSVA